MGSCRHATGVVWELQTCYRGWSGGCRRATGGGPGAADVLRRMAGAADLLREVVGGCRHMLQEMKKKKLELYEQSVFNEMDKANYNP